MNQNHKIGFGRMRAAFFFGIVAVLGIGFLYLIRPFFYPIFWAAVLASMFYPLYARLRARLKIAGLSSAITVLVIIVTILLPLALVTVLLANETLALYRSAVTRGPSAFPRVEGFAEDLRRLPAVGPLVADVQERWTRLATDATRSVGEFVFVKMAAIAQNSARFFFMLFLMIYTLYYFLKDGERMLLRLMHLSPLGQDYERMLYDRFTSTARATLKSTLIVGGIQGAVGGLLFWATGVPGALIWGVVMTALCLIPGIGAFLVWLPIGILMLAWGQIWQGAVILLVGALIISLIDNVLRPPLIGKDTQIHPLIVLFATLGGLIIFGISGFVIGPIIAALFLSVVSIYDVYYRQELEKS